MDFELRGGARTGRLMCELPAVDVATHQEAVLWLPHERLIHTPAARERFLWAARVQADAPGAGLLPILEVLDDERPTIVVPAGRPAGLSLPSLAELPSGLPGLSLSLARWLAPALDAAHARGLVHGCITMTDLWVVHGQKALAGMHLWHHLDRGPLLDALAPALLAPELHAGAEPTVATDVYGLGAVCACVAAGGIAAVPSLRDTQPRLAAVFSRALSVDPASRPASCGALLDQMEEVSHAPRFASGTLLPVPAEVSLRDRPPPVVERRRPPPPPRPRRTPEV